MQLSKYKAQEGNRHELEGNPSVRCNFLSKTPKSLNCYLTPLQAIEFARHLLQKAQLILEEGIDDAAVQVWNVGEDNERLYFGLMKARVGSKRSRRKKGPEPEPESVETAPD